MSDYNRKDHLHQRAKREGTRSRAFYKLQEMQKAHKVIRRGQRVIDLGCWPGGWMQGAAGLVGAEGRVVGVDLAELDVPFSEPNVVAFVGDLEEADTTSRLQEEIGGVCDVLLSDAAPKLTGVRERDRAMEERLLEAIEFLIPKLLAPGGDLLVKILECPEAQQIVKRISGQFGKAKIIKCKSTRKGSTERYLLARDFVAPESTTDSAVN